MGAVYSATDVLLERKVAIKVLKEQSGEDVGKKLRLEARIAARLLHENVVRIYDFGCADATYFLVMEEVNGTSYSKRWRHLSLAGRLQVLAQVAEALDYAHHAGIVHHDVKPANVLLTATDVSKLSDFGLSTVAHQGDLTRVIRGTPHYMSPEQTRGGWLDYRTDLYSLGVMIYESATGGAPFTGTSTSIMSQHVSTEPERPRARNGLVSPELEALIMSLLAKRPEDRPGSGAAVSNALREQIQRIKEEERPGQRSAERWPGAFKERVASRWSVPVAPEPVPGSHGSVTSGPATTAISFPIATTQKGRGTESVRPGAQPLSALATTTGTRGLTALTGSPLARRMLELVLAEPVVLSPDERYLSGHYLAFLLSGSRRHGLFLRRPLEPRNADRGRLLLSLTYALLADATDEAIRESAALLEQRIEVRPALSPIVVAKYLACRDNPTKRKLFRQTRMAIGQASRYAQKRMIDANGVLNPGLMPQRLEDLNLLAPVRTEVNDVLVERWNRVADVWRYEVEFRTAVLRYATCNAHRDPASTGLWPEVVYPLIERARWHRRVRTRTEAVWDYISGKLMHVPGAGVALDRALDRAMPAPLVAHFDESLELMVENAQLDDDEADPFAADVTDRLAASLTHSRSNLAELAAEPPEADKTKGLLRLTDPNPLRFSQGQLHELWEEALQFLEHQAIARPGTKPKGHRPIPIGPFRLAVIPSIRGRAAGQIAIQGMPNKQIELTTPALRTKGSAGKLLLAVWVYCDNSLVVVHLDFMNTQRYVLWHAPKSHQLNFDDLADLRHELCTLGLEVPDQLDQALCRWFQPRKTL
jgi:serine/threonine-protein kinase